MCACPCLSAHLLSDNRTKSKDPFARPGDAGPRVLPDAGFVFSTHVPCGDRSKCQGQKNHSEISQVVENTCVHSPKRPEIHRNPRKPEKLKPLKTNGLPAPRSGSPDSQPESDAYSSPERLALSYDCVRFECQCPDITSERASLIADEIAKNDQRHTRRKTGPVASRMPDTVLMACGPYGFYAIFSGWCGRIEFTDEFEDWWHGLSESE